MKDKTLAYGLFIALGLVVVAIAGSILIPKIKTVTNDADKTKPAMPSPPAITASLDVAQEAIVTYSL